jgi:transposase-like protein
MIFPLTDLLDEQESMAWVEKHFHPEGLRCPGCGATTEHARHFRTRKRGLVDYRCQHCQRVYNLYTGTLFAGSNLEARRVVLLLRGICKGDPSTVLAEELALSRHCIHRWRKRIQANAYTILSQAAVSDHETETDEMFQNAGEKRRQARRSDRSTTAARQQATRARHL